MKRIFALIGKNLKGSLSPQIHTAVYGELCIDAQYNLIETEPDGLKGCLDCGVDGFNVTAPYKETIAAHLERDCSGTGSVNTVTTIPALGYSTDGAGFLLDAKRLGLNLSRVLLLGAGGAARSIAFALKAAGSEVFILGRNVEAAQKLTHDSGTILRQDENNFTLAVNCTGADVNLGKLKAERLYDLRYLGYNGISGIGMLIYQAILSDEIFFDRKIDLKIFDVIYKKLIKHGAIL